MAKAGGAPAKAPAGKGGKAVAAAPGVKQESINYS